MARRVLAGCPFSSSYYSCLCLCARRQPGPVSHSSICFYLSPTPPPCCLLGNVCHSVVPPPARPAPGRTQATSSSSDVKSRLTFRLLPGFPDVSTVSHCLSPPPPHTKKHLQMRQQAAHTFFQIYHR